MTTPARTLPRPATRPGGDPGRRGPARSLRILVVTAAYPSPEAPHRAPYLADLARGLAERGHDVRVVAPRIHPADPRREEGPIPVRRFRFWTTGRILKAGGAGPVRLATWMAGGMAACGRELRAFDPDVIHAHWAIPGGLLASWSRSGTPLACHVHGSDLRTVGRRWPWRPLVRRVLREATATIAVSRELGGMARELGTPDPVRVIPCGVDLDRFRPGDVRAARCSLGLAPDRPVVLYCGDLLPTKGPQRVYRAVRSLLRAGDATFAVVGDGPLRSRLAARARRDGVADRVHLAGARPHEEVPTWMRAASLSALPSTSEGSPVGLAEAIACGTPVLGPTVGGVAERIGEAGRCLDPTDGPAWRRAIAEVLSSPALRSELGQACLEHRSSLGLEASVAAVERVLTDVAREGVNPSPTNEKEAEGVRPSPGKRRRVEEEVNPGPRKGEKGKEKRKTEVRAGFTPAPEGHRPGREADPHDAWWRETDVARRDARTRERVRLAARWLRGGSGRLLDAGCGRGIGAAWAARSGYRVEAVDASPEAVASARRRGVAARRADLVEWAGARPGRYEAILCLEVLEHLERPARALQTLLAALRPGGRLVVSLPNDRHVVNRLRGRSAANPLHVSPFTPGRARELVRRSGARIVGRSVTPLPPPERPLVGHPFLRAAGRVLAGVRPDLFALSLVLCLEPAHPS